MDTAATSLQEITQAATKYLVPNVITTNTTTDFVPDIDKLSPTLAETALSETAAELKKRELKFVDKEFSKLTIQQIYENTIKTTVSIINDISELISEKDLLTNTEFRRKLVDAFLMKERRMYVGILLVVLSFILYFIDSAT